MPITYQISTKKIQFFNDLNYGKNSLFCCNGYNYAIFTILFYEFQVEELRRTIDFLYQIMINH